MNTEHNRTKEPGTGRLLLGALALAAAILLGFVLGLRSGDSNRDDLQADVASVRQLLPSVDTSADSLPVTDTLEASASVESLEDRPGASEPENRITRQQIAQGVEYLASHNRWNRDEMEKLPALQGLWDAVNTYQLDEIRRYNDQLASTPLTTIVEELERTPKQGYYAAKNDHVITLSTYIKRLR